MFLSNLNVSLDFVLGNIKILEKQNSLFPSGSVINSVNYIIFNKTFFTNPLVTIFTWPVAVSVTGGLFMFCRFVSCDESGSLRHLVRKSSNVLLLLSIFLWSSHVTHCHEKVIDIDNNDTLN